MLDTTAEQRAQAVLDDLGQALESGDIDRAKALFVTDCHWRDLVSFTWNIRTLEGPDQVADMLRAQLGHIAPTGWRVDPAEPVGEEDGVVTAWFTFETKVGRGYGLVRLRDGRIWTLLTALQELKGHEEAKGPSRPMGAKHGAGKNRPSWREEREAEAAELGYSRQPHTLIIGGGQGGIALGARLRHLGVPAIIIDTNDRPGDSWRRRYKSLCLHDPVWYDHLPYLKFPDTWPVFAPKDKIGDWLEMYTRVMELNYWTRSTCKSARYDEAKGEWTVVVDRDGEQVTLHPKELVLATGMSGKANVPNFPGMDRFKGEQHHSSKHPGPDAYAGKKVVIVGSNNSAHDIAAALWEHDADVTMIQRSSTHIVKSDSLMEIGLGALYSEEAVAGGMTTEKADLIFASLPYRIMHQWQIPLYNQIRERDADF